MRLLSIAAWAFVLLFAAAPVAAGGAPADPDCWGEATADFAMSGPGLLGEHASSPPPIDLTPDRPGRAGIGNVARILVGPGARPSDAAAALGFACS
jgi:hypothetical protein